jgi:hypothetical protein
MADKGLSARTHDNRALLERWRAQCGMRMNYTATASWKVGSTTPSSDVVSAA